MKIFFFLIIFSFSSNIEVKSQIIYTDILPDSTPTLGLNYNLDLNNDSIVDFVFSTPWAMEYCQSVSSIDNFAFCTAGLFKVVITPMAGNEVLADSFGPIFNVTQLAFHDSINSTSQEWNSDSIGIIHRFELMCYDDLCQIMTYDGPWSRTIDGYVGLRFSANGQNFYGWMQIYLDFGRAQPTYKDYAYNSIPDQQILAGDNGLGANGISDKSTFNNLTIYPNPGDNSIKIDFGMLTEEAVVTILTMTGKKVNEIKIGNKLRVELSTANLSNGFYFIRIQTPSLIEVQKLLIQH